MTMTDAAVPRFSSTGMPINPFDTEAWLDYLADAEYQGRAIDRILDEEPSAVAHDLIRWAVNTYTRLCRGSANAGRHLAEGCATEAGTSYWRGILAITDPTAPCFPSDSPDEPF